MAKPSDEDIARWYPRLFRAALRLTGREAEAADLTQQAFLNAIGHWHEFNGQSLPSSWLHRILLNCVHDWRRRQLVRLAEPLDEWSAALVGDGSPDAAVKAAEGEQLERLREVIRALPEAFRQAFVATVLDGYSYQEAADMLGVPLGTIASRVSSARKLVASAMREAFPDNLT